MAIESMFAFGNFYALRLSEPTESFAYPTSALGNLSYRNPNDLMSATRILYRDAYDYVVFLSMKDAHFFESNEAPVAD